MNPLLSHWKSNNLLKKKSLIKEEPKKVEPKKEFPEKVQIIAKQMKEIFPEADSDKLLEFISNAPGLSMEELIESYLGIN